MISVFKFFGKLPLSFLRKIGLIFSWIFWFSSKKYRLRFKKNWNIARKHSGNAMKKFSLATAIGRAGTFIFELPKIWCNEDFKCKVEINGFHEIEPLLNKGKGLICLSPHLGSFELVPKIFSKRVPVSILYKPPKNIYLDKLLMDLRPSKNVTMVVPNFSGVKKLLLALKKGEVVGLLPDQVPPIKYGITQSFFGQPAYTMTLVSKLILLTNAPVVWTYVEYKKNGWRVTIKPWNFGELAKSSTFEMTKAMNEKIEELILKDPESYMWSYDRYKTPKKTYSEKR
jgi:KDO2-lipid IV(A) lauroyltransferase